MKKLVKYTKILALIVAVILCFQIYLPVHAANSAAGDSFVTCDENGSGVVSGFEDATITISNLDTSGNFIYKGVDVGIFKKPASGTDWDTVFVKRIMTDSLKIKITDLGDMSQYESGQVYALGYKVLYQTLGSDENPIVADQWQKVDGSYFKIKPGSIPVVSKVYDFVTSDGTSTIFTNATITISNLDTSGNFVYKGVDVGIFQKPASGTVWDTVFVKRIMTDSLKIKITDLGDISQYEEGQKYALGYKVLYQTTGLSQNPIVTAQWEKVSNGEFEIKSVEPVAVTDFTDRVTAANNWMDADIVAKKLTEAHAQELNKYFPDSEVVCKFVIDPKGKTIENYNIIMDVNEDNTVGVDVQYIKIVRIDYDGVKGTYKDKPAGPEGADKPLCGKYDGSKTITFNIDNPGKKVVTVYCKYKIKNPKASSDIPSQFKNRVDVKATVTGNPEEPLDPLFNTIRLRKARAQYM